MATADSQRTIEAQVGSSRSASIWRLAHKKANPIVLLNKGEADVPIYCIHPVSGDVVGLRELASLLHTQSFYGVQVPGER